MASHLASVAYSASKCVVTFWIENTDTARSRDKMPSRWRFSGSIATKVAKEYLHKL